MALFSPEAPLGLRLRQKHKTPTLTIILSQRFPTIAGRDGRYPTEGIVQRRDIGSRNHLLAFTCGRGFRSRFGLYQERDQDHRHDEPIQERNLFLL